MCLHFADFHLLFIHSSCPNLFLFSIDADIPAFAEANLAIDMYMFVRTVASYFSGEEETGCAGLRRVSCFRQSHQFLGSIHLFAGGVDLL